MAGNTRFKVVAFEDGTHAVVRTDRANPMLWKSPRLSTTPHAPETTQTLRTIKPLSSKEVAWPPPQKMKERR